MDNFQEKFNAVKEGVRQLQDRNVDIYNALTLAYHYLLLHCDESEPHMRDIKAVIERSREGV
jgi:hypothetical protein